MLMNKNSFFRECFNQIPQVVLLCVGGDSTLSKYNSLPYSCRRRQSSAPRVACSSEELRDCWVPPLPHTPGLRDTAGSEPGSPATLMILLGSRMSDY